MRSREMHNKLDRLSPPAEDDEHSFPDISLLSPEDQDWVHAMFGKLSEESISEVDLRKLLHLLDILPLRGPDEKFKGPDLDIPREIETHFQLFKWHEEGRHRWPRFNFYKLKAVQKVRFVELCRRYGWEGEYPRSRARHYFEPGRWGIPNLVPLSEWNPEDEAELRSLLDLADWSKSTDHDQVSALIGEVDQIV
jgi:hypothetical protein